LRTPDVKIRTVKILVEGGADPTIPTTCTYAPRTPLKKAIHGDDIEIVRVLLNHPKISLLDLHDEHGSTPLCHAGEYGRPAILKLLIERGADFTIPNADGMTPLAIAKKESGACRGLGRHGYGCECILEWNFDPTIADEDRMNIATPEETDFQPDEDDKRQIARILAQIERHRECVKMLEVSFCPPSVLPLTT
jgi:ankyrin repeat protein